MKQQLSANKKSVKAQSLIITKKGKQKLSKNQEAFNKLTQKIEKLQKDIVRKQQQFNLALKIYGQELYPAQLKLLQVRYELIIVLWDIYKSNKLSKTDQRHLKNVLQFHLQQYFMQADTEPDEVLQNIFSEVEGISYEKMMQQEKEKEFAQMQEVFAKMKMDIDELDIDDEAALAKKMAEARQKMEALRRAKEEKYKQQQAKKNKTAKQAAFEKMQQAVAEMKQKNISTIYKQLAKLFHPDLEQEAERKIEKEILMKELTAAYEAKNLHTLLMLELQWIHNQSDHLESLTDEKLNIYLQILKEQAARLENEKNNILQQPQYVALANQFGFEVQQYPVQMVQQRVKNVQDITRDFESDVAGFKSDVALRYVKKMLQHWQQQQKELNEEEEIIRMLFG
ncbi:cell envelope integrity TolA family protein [Ferruginibacter sp.]|nr:hypothetical protein [Ferruginibacter sp.]